MPSDHISEAERIMLEAESKGNDLLVALAWAVSTMPSPQADRPEVIEGLRVGALKGLKRYAALDRAFKATLARGTPQEVLYADILERASRNDP